MWLLLLLVAGGTLLASHLLHEWFPHDEGALGQSAERILRGQMPHRDFADIYTGLLSYLNAATFAVLPISSASMRMPLFAAAMAWLYAMYRIVIRYAPPNAAALIALSAFVWSVPNYPAPMPSWYILFCATFAVLALMRWHESRDRRWLAVAGAVGGIAFLFKLSGVFILLGGGLALLAEDAMPRHRREHNANGRRPGSFETVVPAATLIVTLTLAAIVGRGGGGGFLRFALPIFVVGAAIAARIRLSTPDATEARWTTLIRRFLPFLAGGLFPVAITLGVYAVAGGLPDFVDGVFIAPFRRISFASMSPPPAIASIFVVPVAMFAWLPTTGRRKAGYSIVAAILGAVVVWRSGTDPRFYLAGWLAVWGTLFVVAADVPRWLFAPPADSVDETRRAGVLALACLAVALALIEYPFAAPIYTLYALPLALLALVASVRTRGTTSTSMQLVLSGFLLAFGLLRVNPGTVNHLGHDFDRNDATAYLDLPRSGLWVRPAEARLYGALIPFVEARAQNGSIWAGPDAPEVYFLSGLPNRTRSLFAFLDTRPVATDSLGTWLDSHDIAVAVLNLRPSFSQPPSSAMIEDVRRHYPEMRQFQRFLVAWR